MSPAELRRYLADPAKDGNPAVAAARALAADRDRLAREAGALRARVAELAADVAAYRRENERLRGLLAPERRAPWEGGGGDD